MSALPSLLVEAVESKMVDLYNIVIDERIFETFCHKACAQ